MKLTVRRIIDAFKRQQPDDMAELRVLADAVLAHRFADFASWWQFWRRWNAWMATDVSFVYTPWPDDAAGELIEEWRAS